MPLWEELVKPALDSVTTLIGQFHMSPEEKSQAQQAINDAAAKAQIAAQDYDVQLNSIAGQNIRAEETSDDNFTRRARPVFMYIVCAALAANYVVYPLSQLFTGKTIVPIQLPDNLMWLFGTCVLGYVCSRSAEKVSAMPGDSQINLGGLLKVGNKS